MLEKLSKDYEFEVLHTPSGGQIVVVRSADGVKKIFHQATITSEAAALAITDFMNSLTDELMEGYFPKPRKK